MDKMKTYIGAEYQPKNSAALYWIRLPEHTDIFTEGYVGITKNNVKRRWIQHFEKRKNNIVKRILESEQHLIFQVMLYADTRQYCESIEKALRPLKNIGWNVAPGGIDAYVYVGAETSKIKWIKYWIDHPEIASKRWWDVEYKLIKNQYKKANKPTKPVPFTKVREPNQNNTSGYVGVGWFEKYQMWRAQIGFNGKPHTLGYYRTKEEARHQYLVANDIRTQWRKGLLTTKEALMLIKAK
jgi:hypothetical protein